MTGESLDDAVFNREYEAIVSGGELNLTEFTDTHFEGNIDVAGDRVLCITVPYDPGWTITLDGRELSVDDYSLIGGALYGIPVTEGTHTVAFDFHVTGLKEGLAATCGAVLASVLFFLIVYKMKPDFFAEGLKEELEGEKTE